jgi:drug/metabolite transporter (DMT)-like permease
MQAHTISPTRSLALPPCAYPAWLCWSVSRGVLLFILSQLCMMLDGAAIHHLGPGVTVQQLTLLRGLGCAALLGALMLRGGQGLGVFRTPQPGMQLLRGGLSLAALWLTFYGVGRLPLGDATALIFTAPVWMVLLGASLLREHVPAPRWVATGLGLLGALIVIGPAFGAWNWVYLVLLAGVVLNAAAVVATRHLGLRDQPATILAWVTAIALAGSLPAVGAPLPWADWPALLIVAAAGTGAVWFALLAVREAEVSLLAPYGFVRLPLGILIGLVVFAEIPGVATLLGAALILAAGLLPLLWRG